SASTFPISRGTINSTDTPLLIESLRLAPGARYIASEFDFDRGGVISDTIDVIGPVRSSEHGAAPLWQIRSTSGPTIWNWWLDPTSRRLIRVEFAPRSGGR